MFTVRKLLSICVQPASFIILLPTFFFLFNKKWSFVTYIYYVTYLTCNKKVDFFFFSLCGPSKIKGWTPATVVELPTVNCSYETDCNSEVFSQVGVCSSIACLFCFAFQHHLIPSPHYGVTYVLKFLLVDCASNFPYAFFVTVFLGGKSVKVGLL